MDDPKVTIGGRDFSVPEFSGWAQRTVTPALMKVAGNVDISDEETFGRLLDTVFKCLTIQTVDGRKDGKPVNAITVDEFEALHIRPVEIAMKVLPVLFKQAGLTPNKDAAALPGGVAPMPGTPLPGETISTTSPQALSSDSSSTGTPPSV